MKKNFEIDIDKNLNEDIEIPKSILLKKEEAFKIIEKNKKYKKNKKILVACVALCILTISTVTFADDAAAYIKRILFNGNKGVQTAIDNEYVQDLNDLTMEDAGVNIKVDKFAIDNSRAVVSMKVNFEDEDIKKSIIGMKASNRLLSNGEPITENAKHEFTVDYNTKEITYNTVFKLNDKLDYNDITLEISSIDLFADLNSDTPWAESISDQSKESIIEEGIKIFKIVKGNWKTNIKLDEKFKNPKIISYKASEENDSIDVISAQATPTGMDIKFEYKNQNKENNIPSDIRKSLYHMKMTNEEGQEFKCDGFLSSSMIKEGKSTFEKTFYITSFDCEDLYTLEVLDLNGEIQKIHLVKDK